MPDYDINRLGDRAFEQLVVSLAANVLGAGVQAFGDGPDGGREATYDGLINWSATGLAASGKWDGYTVIQAKFHYHQSSPKENLAWLKSQINTELDRWVEAVAKGKRARPPAYLIVASNVRLSSVGVTGGIDAIEAHLRDRIHDRKDLVNGLGIRDFQVWHADQINSMLDRFDAVRRAFPGLLTVGDVLAKIGDNTPGSSLHALAEKMRLHAAQCLRNEHWIRFSEAGADSGQRSKLEEVGIDLLGSTMIRVAERKFKNDKFYTAKRIVTHGDAVLRRTLTDTVKRPHFVIIGGPGQGKTTISSLIAQVYRSELLSRGESTREVAAIISNTRHAMDRIGIPPPGNLRWPMRVDLSRYADVLASDPNKSILAYLATEIGHRTDLTIHPADLHTWLCTWPWLVIFDGLDEVSELHVRRTLMERITDLMESADSVQADLMVVATTRPLGYDERFDPDLFTEIRLEPLPPQHALRYGSALIDKRLADDPELREIVQRRLATAVKNSSTARLMRSPLQVAIMSYIVEGYGTLPPDRYGLFALYYRIVYQREIEKRGTVSRALSEHRSDIGFIHRRVALSIHARTEKGNFSRGISFSEMEAITRDRLKFQGYKPHEVDKISDSLIKAAMHRLVLIVPQGDYVRFEVRSLQEFMTAEAFISGTEDKSLKLLRVTAHHPHWRNVWLLAAGYLFKEREHLHDSLLGVLARADREANPVYQTAPTAPVLAADILDDGFASRAPAARRRYIEAMLSTLDCHLGELRDIIAITLTRNCVTSEDQELAFSKLISALEGTELSQWNASIILSRLSGMGDFSIRSKANQIFNQFVSEKIQLKYSLQAISHTKRSALPRHRQEATARPSEVPSSFEIELTLTLIDQWQAQDSSLSSEECAALNNAREVVIASARRHDPRISDDTKSKSLTEEGDAQEIGLSITLLVEFIDRYNPSYSETILRMFQSLFSRIPVGNRVVEIIS